MRIDKFNKQAPAILLHGIGRLKLFFGMVFCQDNLESVQNKIM